MQSFYAILNPFFDLSIENMVLRQQIVAFKRKNRRQRLRNFDRVFLVLIRRCWNRWKNALILVKPETVVRWHCNGFRLYWRFISRKGEQRRKPRISREIRELSYKMAYDNPTWRAPRIHGELMNWDFIFRNGQFPAICRNEFHPVTKSKNG